MHRSSETIGAIAAALAKAQAELTNPEKSLVATIRSRDAREGERTFRYASLSSGLEIVRKSLGKHEIATIQTTEIDREVGLIRLTTVLAHASGEWMSSDWPVCPIADASAPQRMGAALTYARRYALFTLVGIAGEDDLDAPDITGARTDPRVPDGSIPPPIGSNGHAAASNRGSIKDARGMGPPKTAPPILGLEASAGCRDRLLDEIAETTTADELALWAQRVLPTKNTLRTEDATIIEKAFTAKLGEFTTETQRVHIPIPGDEAANSGVDSNAVQSQSTELASGAAATEGPVDLAAPNLALPDSHCAALAFGKTRRKRDKDHRAFVASKPCLVCGRCPADAHHLRFAQPRALGRKVSDEFTVPLCRTHHRELHLRADEPAWWEGHKIDALDAAQRLWAQTHRPSPQTTATNTLL